MKKAYVTPTVEKVEFQYDKAVVASGGCTTQAINYDDNKDKVCDREHDYINKNNN